MDPAPGVLVWWQVAVIVKSNASFSLTAKLSTSSNGGDLMDWVGTFSIMLSSSNKVINAVCKIVEF